MQKKEWFADWFDTRYYHILYKNRDFDEAKRFIHRLLDHLELEAGAKVLDLACGKGRHAKTLADAGLDVLGADLSANSIETARQFEHDHLRFQVHDMREIIQGVKFDTIFNLFTSFGYFDNLDDNLKVVQSIKAMLNQDGKLVIDFMNAHKIIQTLVHDENKTVDGIDFRIKRSYSGSHILKHIEFEAEDQTHAYTERVQALKLADFEYLFRQCDLEIISTFGSSDLQPFDRETSDRLIIMAQSK